MGIFRFIKYKRALGARKRQYASLALSIALAHGAIGAVKYKSVGNGMADISLDLEEDQKFILNVNNNVEHKKYQLKGKWTYESDSYVLRFSRTPKELNNLFTGQAGFANYAEIADKRTVKFPATRAGLLIDGIYCTRAIG